MGLGVVLGDLGASWAPLGVVLGGHGAVDGPNRAEATLVGPKNKKKGGLLRSLVSWELKTQPS